MARVKSSFYLKYKIVVFFTTALVFLYSLFVDKPNGYSLLPFIPFFYLVMFATSGSLNILSQKSRGILVLNILMYLRYVIAVLIIMLTKDYYVPTFYSISFDPESIEKATLFMIIEMISIFAVLMIGEKIIYGKVERKQDAFKSNNKVYGPIIYCFIIVASILAFIYRDYFLPGVVSENELLLNENSSHELYLVFWCLKTIAMGVAINWLINRYKNKNSVIYIVGSYIIVFLYILLNISNSRVNIIIPLAFLAFITDNVFKKLGRVVLTIFLVLTTIIIMIVTVYKNPYLTNSSYGQSSSYVRLMQNTQEYTSNLRPMAYGLEMADVYKEDITFKTFLNDALGSVPIVSHYINQNDRINHYYNLYAINGKNESLIIPMASTSIAYFSPLLSFVLTDFFIICLMVYDSKALKRGSDNYLQSYIDLYICFVLAYSINGNVQMIVGRVITRYLPIMVLLLVNKFSIIGRKKRLENEK